MKKFTAILLILMLVVSFGACNKNKNDEPKGNNDPVVDPAEPDPADDPVTEPVGLTKYSINMPSALITVYSQKGLYDYSSDSLGYLANHADYQTTGDTFLAIFVNEYDRSWVKKEWGITEYDDWLDYDWPDASGNMTVEKNPYGLISTSEIYSAEGDMYYSYAVMLEGDNAGNYYQVEFEILSDDISGMLTDIIYWTSLIKVEEGKQTAPEPHAKDNYDYSQTVEYRYDDGEIWYSIYALPGLTEDTDAEGGYFDLILDNESDTTAPYYLQIDMRVIKNLSSDEKNMNPYEFMKHKTSNVDQSTIIIDSFDTYSGYILTKSSDYDVYTLISYHKGWDKLYYYETYIIFITDDYNTVLSDVLTMNTSISNK